MELAPETTQSTSQAPARFDVLIVGAGISGIDAAYHLQRECPEKSFALLENQASFGGTWITHRFPDIRSDSDLYTYGYSWKPWSSAPIATAEEILAYLDEVLDEQNIRQHIRFHHHVKSARWSSEDKCWTLEVERKDTGEKLLFTCRFLWMCQGYYRHSEGYTPEFPGVQRFQGQIVHPQSWPQILEYRGKTVLVIGSGATAATLVPAMAEHAAHVTMLQRSPTYYFPAANRTEIADLLRTLDVPEEWVHEITRRKVLQDQQTTIHRSFNDSQALKKDLIAAARAYLGEDFDVETHFTPSYRPWRQRLCFLPDGDLFRSIRAGKASVVTDRIETFTEKGIMLVSGKELEADIIVTATGLNLCPLGDIDFTIDGEPLNFAECWGHRGILFSGVPNMAWVFGYLRASWTLRADLVSQFVCRLLNYMTEKGAAVVTPQLRAQDQDMPKLPWVDPENFNAGYLMRSMHMMPKQGDREPWTFSQDYQREKDEIPAADLEDGTLLYQ
jgi:cation diffusion facilitator CzcD-associated flavoprotein CzcO